MPACQTEHVSFIPAAMRQKSLHRRRAHGRNTSCQTEKWSASTRVARDWVLEGHAFVIAHGWYQIVHDPLIAVRTNHVDQENSDMRGSWRMFVWSISIRVSSFSQRHCSHFSLLREKTTPLIRLSFTRYGLIDSFVWLFTNLIVTLFCFL